MHTCLETIIHFLINFACTIWDQIQIPKLKNKIRLLKSKDIIIISRSAEKTTFGILRNVQVQGESPLCRNAICFFVEMEFITVKCYKDEQVWHFEQCKDS